MKKTEPTKNTIYSKKKVSTNKAKQLAKPDNNLKAQLLYDLNCGKHTVHREATEPDQSANYRDCLEQWFFVKKLDFHVF